MSPVERYDLFLPPEPGRVVLRPFQIASEPRDQHPLQASRMDRIVRSVDSFDDEYCARLLEEVLRDFSARHKATEQTFRRRFEQVARMVDGTSALTDSQKMLVGAYFCHEYSYAAAALMNPSIVPHPNQWDLEPGSTRFVLSLRAVGEGHISSIVFREGEIDAVGKLKLYPHDGPAAAVEADEIRSNEVVHARRPDDVSISEQVIFPFTPAQRNGLEDLRLVAFNNGGSTIYYGTYTAYSGKDIRSELLATTDFGSFALTPMRGAAALNKGMALFPRRVDSAYAMIGRQDGESMYFLQSDDVLQWERGARIAEPRYPWELIQMGNCGSPIELDEGWLLLTHGVGPMRRYAIGAMLLDKASPQRVLGRTAEPILSPSPAERDGYVPNVVYTCGAIKHHDHLIVPYGVSDRSVAFAKVDLKWLLGQMI